jgi:glutathione-independent formaldehyde dehydrogenase
VPENRCVVYQGPGEVTVEDIGYPELKVPEYVSENMGDEPRGPARRYPADRLHQHLR